MTSVFHNAANKDLSHIYLFEGGMSNICPTAPDCGHAICVQIMGMANDMDVSCLAVVALAHARTRIRRPIPVPKRTSSLSGYSWMCELMEGNENRFHEQMRMDKRKFIRLIHILTVYCGLGSCGRLDPMESVGMFIKIVASGFSYSDVGERFQHSNETISRHFRRVLQCFCTLGNIMIAPITPRWNEIPWEISSDPRYSGYFDGFLGVIDGTHVNLRKPDSTDTSSWVDWHGQHSTNILAVVDFDMCVTFADVGKEGSMHDARLLHEDMRSAYRPYPFPPVGKYYLADSGFPELLGLLTPYKNIRYQIPAFREARTVRNPLENFNRSHASLRSLVERTFGIIKVKWRVLNYMAKFDLETQIRVVWACFALHNFCIRMDYEDFDSVFEYLLHSEYMRIVNRDNPANPPRPEFERDGAKWMSNLRDYIRDSIPFAQP